MILIKIQMSPSFYARVLEEKPRMIRFRMQSRILEFTTLPYSSNFLIDTSAKLEGDTESQNLGQEVELFLCEQEQNPGHAPITALILQHYQGYRLLFSLKALADSIHITGQIHWCALVAFVLCEAKWLQTELNQPIKPGLSLHQSGTKQPEHTGESGSRPESLLPCTLCGDLHLCTVGVKCYYLDLAAFYTHFGLV